MPDQLRLWGGDTPDDRLRWSVSRDRRMRSCLRKYYLFHYGARGGQDPSASARARELFVLRRLCNRYMWVGVVVHDLVELALAAWQRGESVPLQGLIERGTRTMRAHYAESLQGVYWDRPMQAMGLVEHEYKEAISREEWRAQRDHMERCVRHFYDLPLAAEIRALPRWRLLALESSGRFELEGATVTVRPDVAWRASDDLVVMVDWKTGYPRPDEEELQLGVYGIFARRSWGLGSDHMRAIAAYLANGEVRAFEVDLQTLQDAEDKIAASIQRMRGLVGEGDPPIENFPMTEDVDTCKSCGFKRICSRE